MSKENKGQGARCENCGWNGFLGDVIVLGDVPDLAERISPGEEVPAGECPDCGALAHLDPVQVCKTCGNDCAGAPPSDVRIEDVCFPCQAGSMEFHRDVLWDALSEILEEPKLVLPHRLRKMARRAIRMAQRNRIPRVR